MSGYPDNIFKAVETLQPLVVARALSKSALFSMGNRKYNDLQNLPGQLGATMTTQLPTKTVATDGLPVKNQAIKTRYAQITVDQALNASWAVTDPQRIFNLSQDGFEKEIGESMSTALAQTAEVRCGLSLNGELPIVTYDSENNPIYTGQKHTDSGATRFFGDGVTPVNTYYQLAQGISQFSEVGDAGEHTLIVPSVLQATIVNTALSQFVLRRNEKIAVNWYVGEVGDTTIYSSDKLPVHISGVVGNTTTGYSPEVHGQLTIVSIDGTSQTSDRSFVTQITCTGSFGNTLDAIKLGDLCQVVDVNSLGDPINMVATYGKNRTQQPVQFRVVADAASVSGTIVLQVTAGHDQLNGIPGDPEQYMTKPLAPGMEIWVAPSHRGMYLITGDAFFIANPALPKQTPFPSENKTDSETGANFRLTYGSNINNSTEQFTCASIFYPYMIPSYGYKFLIPLSQR